MSKEPQTIAGDSRWLARGLGKSFSYLLHFATNVSLWIGVGLVASQQPPSRVFVLVVVGLTLPLHLIIPVPFGFSAQRSTSAAKVMRTYIRNLKVAAVFLTVVVVVLIIIAPLASSGEPVIPAGSWIAMVLAHWVSLILMDVLHPAPTLPPNKTDQSDSDSDDEAGAK